MYTNHKDIRKEAGFYRYHYQEEVNELPNSSRTVFSVNTELNGDVLKFIPTGTTNTLFSTDVTCYYGLSGLGMTTIAISALDANIGSVTLAVAPVTGSSILLSYASSSILADEVERYRLIAESTVNNVLSASYSVPLSSTVSEVSDLATKLAAGYLLMQHYGANSLDTSTDGKALVDYVLGVGDNAGKGRLYMLIEKGQLVADDGTVITRTDEDDVSSSLQNVGAYTGGQIFTMRDEPFTFSRPDKDIATGNVSSDRD